MKKQLFVIALGTLSAFNFSFAQMPLSSNLKDKEKSDHTKEVTLKSIGPINMENQVMGYYSLTVLDKIDKKNVLMGLDVYDNNLHMSQSLELKRHKDEVLLANAFNGENFFFTFFDLKKHTRENIIVDLTGAEVGKTHVEKLDKNDARMATMIASADASGGGGSQVYGVPGRGFLITKNVVSGLKMRSNFELVDNKGAHVWEFNPESIKSLGSIISGNPVYANNEVVIIMLNGRDGVMSKKINVAFAILDAKTGKEKFQVKGSNKNFALYPLGINYNPETKSFMVYGEYFKPKARVMKDNSIGYYLQEINDKGEIIRESEASWMVNMKKFVKADAKGRINKYYTITHSMVKLKDNHIYVVGEQYKKTFNPVGLLAVNSSSNLGLAQLVINDLIVFDFDEKLNLNGVKTFDKPKDRVWLPKGYMSVKPRLLAFMAKSYDWFDYEFLTTNADKSKLSIGTTNKNAFEVISLNDDKELVSDKFKKDKDYNYIYFMPAKPGYVCIFEYSSRKKAVRSRLEKVNL